MKQFSDIRHESRFVRIGVQTKEITGAISCPIYMSAAYRHPAVGQSTGFDYTRSGNPTRQALEDGLALLESGSRAFAFSSGMAAITTLLLHFSSGDHLIFSEDLYGGTYRLMNQVLSKLGLTASFVDTTSLGAVTDKLTSRTKAIFIETPGNPLLKLTDIKAIADLCHANGLLCIVDNTFFTPALQRPLELGADVVVHSATKYLGGHNDLCAGVLVAKDSDLGGRIYFLQNSSGAILSPQDCWLLMRSMKTLPIRMERHCSNAMVIAQWLCEHPRITAVYYPGLAHHQGHELAKRQASSFGGIISFRVQSPALAREVINRLQLISFAESLGGVESLMTIPALQTHCDIPEKERIRLGISEDLLRLSVGIENIDDLIEDLTRALL